MRIVSIALLALSLSPQTASAQQSFYVVRHFFSDDLSGWNDTVLDVTQSGDDVRVRLTQIALAAHHECSPLLVQTVDRVLPHTTVRNVAGANMCASTERQVVKAIEESRRTAVLTDAASQYIHVECAGSARDFQFPFDSSLDEKKLARSYGEVAALQNVVYHVRDVAFGHSFWFQPDAQQDAREQLGMTTVPELTAGKYDSALGAGLLGQLKQYHIPPRDRGPRPPQLIDRDRLHLIRYEAPMYPPVARAARVQGDVHLRLIVNMTTGAVTGAEVVSGPPLFNTAALAAAQSWVFDPVFLTTPEIEATVRFSLDC